MLYAVKMLWIHTTRVSAVVGAFLERYSPAEVLLDLSPVSEPQEQWCTNATLRRALNFSMHHNGVEVLGFHDGPDNMWAHESTLPFVEELKEKKLLRFSSDIREPRKEGWLSKVVRYVFGV